MAESAALPAGIRLTRRQCGAFRGAELDLQAIGEIATHHNVEQTARKTWQHGQSVFSHTGTVRRC